VRRLLGLLVLLGLALGAWTAREPILTAIGSLVVEETPLRAADVVVFVADNAVLLAAETASIVRAGHAPRVLVLAPPAGPDARILADLGITVPRDDEVAVLVLRRLGVPREAITVLTVRVDGTNAAVRTIARHAAEHRVSRMIVVTHRSHTRRTARLLRRLAPPETVVMARAPADDPYRAEGWWRERGSARELALEGLRWVNSLVLGDLWGDPAREERRAGAPRHSPASR
jgi:uncharacterized SAM-binding protein YcdF (DUF218 family)